MKLFTLASILLLSFHVQASWLKFGHVTPFTESEYKIEINASISKINKTSVNFHLTNLPKNKDVFLIQTKEHRPSYEQKFREEIWDEYIEENRRTKMNTGYEKNQSNPIILNVKLKPVSVDKYGIKVYSIDIDKEKMKTSYIYIDYPKSVRDGGYYYSIDLKEYISSL
ncbi:hypothetical protein [Colwellia echini]|nr:hypothetical protein [Colwellia echini]